MLPTWFAFVCLAALWFMRRREHGVVTLVIVSTAFGATAAAEVVLLGGAPLTPVMFLLPFLAWHALRQVGINGLTAELRLDRPGGWLALFCVWGAFSAVAMPRLFQGETLVFTVDRGVGLGVMLTPLEPNGTNITQSVYLLSGLVMFATMAALLRRSPGARKAAFDGLIVLGVVNATGAFVQLIEAYGGIPLGLSLLRNAGYAITEGQAVGRLVRIHGVFAETSSFSAFSVPLCMAYFVCWAAGLRRRWTAPLALVTLGLVVMTTSTTAYVALALAISVVSLLVVLEALRSGPVRLRFGAISACLLGLLILVCLVLLTKPTFFDGAIRVVDEMVFNKLASESGQERGDWTARAWANFLETYGWGAGAGSSRGSSWPVVILGNVGWLGGAAMLVFLAMVGLSRSQTTPCEPGGQVPSVAIKACLLALLLGATASGTMVDPGASFYLYAGWIVGLAGAAQLAPTRPDPCREGGIRLEPRAKGTA